MTGVGEEGLLPWNPAGCWWEEERPAVTVSISRARSMCNSSERKVVTVGLRPREVCATTNKRNRCHQLWWERRDKPSKRRVGWALVEGEKGDVFDAGDDWDGCPGCALCKVPLWWWLLCWFDEEGSVLEIPASGRPVISSHTTPLLKNKITLEK